MSNAKRKTVPVTDLIDEANRFLGFDGNNPETRDSDNLKGMRSGIALYLEHFLHATGNYRGFGYVSPDGIANDRGQFDPTMRRYNK